MISPALVGWLAIGLAVYFSRHGARYWMAAGILESERKHTVVQGAVDPDLVDSRAAMHASMGMGVLFDLLTLTAAGVAGFAFAHP